MESEGEQGQVSQEPARAEDQQAPPMTTTAALRSGGAQKEEEEKEEKEEKSFLSNLHGFMKERGAPIERIPHLGFKQINLWRIYKAVGKLGGYDSVTARRLWKSVYDDLGGSPGSTSAATCTRRHYERLVLPFDRHLRGEADKPLPQDKPRKQYRRNSEKAGKERGKRTTVRMEKELREARRRAEAAEQCETGAQAHVAPWTTVPGALPRVPSTGIGLSPLEKKKREAQQASLRQPPPPPPPPATGLLGGDERDRPSVIHCPAPLPQAPAMASGTASDSDSAGPVSSSSSFSSSSSVSPRSASPDSSLGSEDLPPPAPGGRRDEADRDTPPNCVALVSRVLPKGPGDVSFPGIQMLKVDSIQTQNIDSVWKAFHRGSGRDSAHVRPKLTSSSPLFTMQTDAIWPPAPTSSFTKVIPKPTQPIKPTPFLRGYKIYPVAGQQQQHDLTMKKLHHHFPLWPYQTSERRDKSKALSLSLQPRALYTCSQPPSPYVLTGYGCGSLSHPHPHPPPPLPPQAFIPERTRTPHSQPLYHQAPAGRNHAAHLGSAAYGYPSYCLAWGEYPLAGASPPSTYPYKR